MNGGACDSVFRRKVAKAARHNGAVKVLIRYSFLAALLLCPAPALWAHKVQVFAAAEGREISGTAYFSGGGRVRDHEIRVETPEGEELARVRTDAEGAFAFTARRRVDHVLILKTGDGHLARFVVEAEELPPDLEGGEPSPALAAAAPEPRRDEPTAARPPAERGIDEAVARQVRPLREQLNRLEEQIRFRDILGGIGYLVGVAGVAFYFLGARRMERRRKRSDAE